MATIRKTITLTEKQDEWLKAQIANGDFTNDSEYLRDLVRRDQEQNAQFQVLKSAIQEGLNSGVSNKTLNDIMEEVEARLGTDGRHVFAEVLEDVALAEAIREGQQTETVPKEAIFETLEG